MTTFRPAGQLLLPNKEIPLAQWAVVACDQFSSQPEYWEEAGRLTAGGPSAFRFILPECWLEEDNAGAIGAIQEAMSQALRDGTLRAVEGRYLYCQRTLSTGRVRHGIIGVLDLEQYDYHPGSPAMVRATEGTVADRLPPRMAVRRGAALELPHVLVLLDDRARTVVEPLAALTGEMTLEYDGSLMLGGGSIRGWSMTPDQGARVDAALAALEAQGGMTYAVGDGNHSLATAKECFEELKHTLSREQWEHHPARYALVELGNLYDDSLEFEPVHRLLVGVNPGELLDTLTRELGLIPQGGDAAQGLGICLDGQKELTRWIGAGASPLAVGSLQPVLDAYLAVHPGAGIDYIHGDDDLRRLVAGRPDALGILLPAMPKEDLFPGVMADGVLPRKTFSMGHARDKRYYLECRAIL